MQYVRSEAVVDLSAAAGTTAFTMEAPAKGKFHVNLLWARVEEAIGTFTSVTPVASVEIGGTEQLTVTPTASDAIGESYKATAASTVGDDGVVYFDAGDDIVVKTKTQGTGGTTTGTLRFYLPITWENVSL